MSLPASAPVVISGATGNTSREAIKVLVAHNIPVRALVRSRAKAAALLPASDLIEIFEIDDLTNFPRLLEAYKGARGAYIITTGLEPAFRTVGAQAQAAKESHVPQIVFLSSALTTYGPNIIGKIHQTCEEFFNIYNFPSFTALCPDYFYSNFELQKNGIIKMGQVVSLTFDSPMAAIDPTDIGACAAQVFIDGPEKHRNQRYVLTCEQDQALSMPQMVELISKYLGKEIACKSFEPEAWINLMKPFMSEFDRLAVADCGQQQRHAFKPTTDVRKVLGRKPRGFEEYIKENIDNFQ